MKICLINNLYKPFDRGGGAERITNIIHDGLIKNNHQVFVISSKPYFQKVAQENNYYLNSLFYYLNKIPKIIRLAWHVFDIFDFRIAYQVKKIIKKEKPDIVITNNLKGLSYLIPWVIKQTNAKHIHVLHDIQLIHPSGLMIYGEEKIIDSFWARAYTKLCARLFRFSNIVISPSAWLLEIHKQRDFFKNSQTIAIPNPCPCERLNHEKTKHKFRFLYVGKINRHKGFPFLIKAWQKFKTSGLDAELFIIGDGKSLSESKKIVSGDESIKFLGFMENKKAKRHMFDADCLLVPSLCYENSPTVIYEAHYLELPVIASRLGGTTELVHALGGFLFSPNNEADLVKQMAYVFNHQDKAKKIAQEGRKKINNYDVQNYLSKIMAIIQN